MYQNYFAIIKLMPFTYLYFVFTLTETVSSTLCDVNGAVAFCFAIKELHLRAQLKEKEQLLEREGKLETRNDTIWPSRLGAAFWARLFGRQLTVRHSHLGAIRFGAKFNKF